MMRVLKFGGSSVSDATRISSVMDIVGDAVRAGRAVLVCSAVSGCTDALIKIASLPEGEQRDSLIEALRLRHQAIVKRLFTGEERQAVSAEVDVLFGELQEAPSGDCVTFGELFSTVIIARKFACDGVSTQWLDSRRLIRTRRGEVDRDRTYAAIRDAVAECPDTALFVAPGFIASDEDGRLTTLGRGGPVLVRHECGLLDENDVAGLEVARGKQPAAVVRRVGHARFVQEGPAVQVHVVRP